MEFVGLAGSIRVLIKAAVASDRKNNLLASLCLVQASAAQVEQAHILMLSANEVNRAAANH